MPRPRRAKGIKGDGERRVLNASQPVLQSGVAVPPALESAVRSYLGHLAVERGLAANTLSSYRRDLRRYMAALAGRGRTAIDQVGEDDVRSFLAALREGDDEHPPLSAGSAARAVVAGRAPPPFVLRGGVGEGDPDPGRPPPTPP